ncbi:Hypothetical predicted protein [Xyrichtys novacula]|uniref:Uncharacterized protein n=1 Tax=Xyrichtys novacula TaxID=13765 RepID=A0AAV1EJY6_XYRNO|nr:Hypothetical predicted protein [Xyrichtys novacula]
MVRSCYTASLIPEPLPQSCQSTRCASLCPCTSPPFSFPVTHERGIQMSAVPEAQPPPPPPPTSSSSPSSPSSSYATLCLPPSIPDCSPPRTAKDILLSEIRVISADMAALTQASPAGPRLWTLLLEP